jgi:hypothetical protein
VDAVGDCDVRAVLPPSLTHAYRAYVMAAGDGWYDGFLSIQVGQVGPSGGTSRLVVAVYDVQEVDPDPLWGVVPWREFLLAKDDRSGAVYRVRVYGRGVRPQCTCDGFRRWGACKHGDSLEHAVLVRGWRPARSRPLAGVGGRAG